MRNITVAHSPDADDIFMYYAISFGFVSSKYFSFTNMALDIETLNEEALKERFDATAISFALYPHIYERFSLLRTAVSFGEGYGPKLIKKEGKILKRNFKVALSGKNTTNAMLFRIAYPDARIIYKNFLEIEDAVLNGEVDAGVLIHESILDFNSELVVEREIWDIWKDLTKSEIPLPLGGMALRRAIPITSAIAIEEILIKAVSVAIKSKEILSKMLLERNLVRIDAKMLEKYLSLYANEDSIELSESQLKSIDALFRIGYDNGQYKRLIEAEKMLIPREYNNFRYS